MMPGSRPACGCKAGLDGLSAERIRQEMFKLMAAKGAIPTLKLMAEQGILAHLLPYTEEWRVLERLPPGAAAAACRAGAASRSP